jgi:DNA repair exonuclease SbcCD nuclease subunit
MPRFLHSADWQLGMTRHFLEGEAQARFTASSRIEVIGAIGALAAEQGCSFVVVGGDVFESSQVERQVVVRALDTMKATLGVTFYLLPGNHDPLDAASCSVRGPSSTTVHPTLWYSRTVSRCLSRQASRSSVLRGSTSGR